MTPPPPGTPMVNLDFDPKGLLISECPSCEWWWAELVNDEEGLLVLREWHEVSCPSTVEWADD
jgi:hypothetical protein